MPTRHMGRTFVTRRFHASRTPHYHDCVSLCAGHINHDIFWTNLIPHKARPFVLECFVLWCRQRPTLGKLRQDTDTLHQHGPIVLM